MENKLLSCISYYSDKTTSDKEQATVLDKDSFTLLKKSKRFIIDGPDEIIKLSHESPATDLMLPFKILAIEVTGEIKKECSNWLANAIIVARQLSDKELVLNLFRNLDGIWERMLSDVQVTLNDKELFDITCKYIGSDNYSSKEKNKIQNQCNGFSGYMTAVVFGIISFLHKKPEYVESKRLSGERKISVAGIPSNVNSYRRITLNKPVSPSRGSKGGTHASPRMHERRGFWRRGRNNTKHWVNATIVNQKAGAEVITDYVIDLNKTIHYKQV